MSAMSAAADAAGDPEPGVAAPASPAVAIRLTRAQYAAQAAAATAAGMESLARLHAAEAAAARAAAAAATRRGRSLAFTTIALVAAVVAGAAIVWRGADGGGGGRAEHLHQLAGRWAAGPLAAALSRGGGADAVDATGSTLLHAACAGVGDAGGGVAALRATLAAAAAAAPGAVGALNGLGELPLHACAARGSGALAAALGALGRHASGVPADWVALPGRRGGGTPLQAVVAAEYYAAVGGGGGGVGLHGHIGDGTPFEAEVCGALDEGAAAVDAGARTRLLLSPFTAVGRTREGFRARRGASALRALAWLAGAPAGAGGAGVCALKLLRTLADGGADGGAVPAAYAAAGVDDDRGFGFPPAAQRDATCVACALMKWEAAALSGGGGGGGAAAVLDVVAGLPALAVAAALGPCCDADGGGRCATAGDSCCLAAATRHRAEWARAVLRCSLVPAATATSDGGGGADGGGNSGSDDAAPPLLLLAHGVARLYEVRDVTALRGRASALLAAIGARAEGPPSRGGAEMDGAVADAFAAPGGLLASALGLHVLDDAASRGAPVSPALLLGVLRAAAAPGATAPFMPRVRRVPPLSLCLPGSDDDAASGSGGRALLGGIVVVCASPPPPVVWLWSADSLGDDAWLDGPRARGIELRLRIAGGGLDGGEAVWVLAGGARPCGCVDPDATAAGCARVPDISWDGGEWTGSLRVPVPTDSVFVSVCVAAEGRQLATAGVVATVTAVVPPAAATL